MLVKTGPGRRNRSGPVPAWGLKLGGLFTTLAVFAGSFGYANTHLYVTNAPLQPAHRADLAELAHSPGLVDIPIGAEPLIVEPAAPEPPSLPEAGPPDRP